MSSENIRCVVDLFDCPQTQAILYKSMRVYPSLHKRLSKQFTWSQDLELWTCLIQRLLENLTTMMF